MRRLLPILLLAAACAACVDGVSREGGGLVVYAASSLEPALEAGAAALEEAAGASLVFNFGASNDLLRQILAARQADIFLSADEIQMDRLESAGLVEPGTRVSFLANRLVVVAPAGSGLEVASAADLAGSAIARLAIGDPGGVPAGRYARSWLEREGVWEQVAERIVPVPDARAVLAAVESGGVQAGIAYRTDAMTSGRVAVLYEVPAGEDLAITYSAAAVAGGSRLPEAQRLIRFLQGAGAEKIFGPLGFVVMPRDTDRIR